MITLPSQNEPLVAAGGLLSRPWRTWLQSLVSVKVAERLQPTEVKTSAYTARPWDLVNADPSSAGFTVTLPEGAKSGDLVAYKNTTTSSNAVTFDPADGDTVDEQASVQNTTSRGSEHFVFDADRRNWSRL